MQQKRYQLALTAIIMGIAGMLLRFAMFSAYTDEQNLLKHNSVSVLVWVLSAAAAVVFLLGTKDWKKQKKFSEYFPPSKVGFLGTVVGAIGIFAVAMADLLDKTDSVRILSGILGLLAAPALGIAGFERARGKRTSFILYLVVVLFLLFNLLAQYRSTRNAAQLPSYAFQLLSCSSLILAAYHRMAFEVNLETPRFYHFWALLAVFFCILCLAQNINRLFYVTQAVWLVTNLCADPVDREEEAKLWTR